MKIVKSFFIFLFFPFMLMSQVNFEGWRVHLPYFKNASITAVGSKIYCGSNSGLFSLETEDGSMERLSKINGLSDVEVKLVKHNFEKKITLVVYNNANIDIIDETSRQIYNVPDVFMKSIIGSKSINHFCFFENKVFLACAFGIVVLDLDKKQIIDSYQNLGPGGSQLEFLSVSIFNNQIVASSKNGIYAASLSSPNLNDFNFWKNIKSSTSSGKSQVYKGNLYVLVDDVLQVYDGVSSWQNYTAAAGLKIMAMQLSTFQSNSADLLIITPEKILVEKGDLNPQTLPHTYRNDAVYDNRNFLCMVDDNYGLTIDNKNTGQLDYYTPNGPISKTFGHMLYENEKLWVTGGSVNDRWDPLEYNGSKFYQYQNNSWFNFTEKDFPELVGMSDFIDVCKNPYGNEVYVSSFGNGVVELVNNKVQKKYDDNNSSLQRLSIVGSNYKPLLSGGMDVDNSGNLWVSNFGVSKPLSVKVKNTWYSYSIGTLLGGNELGWLTCDDYNNKWVLTLRDKGILVYNDNGTPANLNDDQFKLLNKEVGRGELPSNTVLCVSKDQRGEMWIGTNLGLAI